MAIEQDHDERLAGRTVVITGAASGIGRAIALGAHAAGAAVIAADLNASGLGEIATDGIWPVPTDVTDQSQVQTMIDKAIEHTGRIDVLVNNAGINGAGTIFDIDDGFFESTMSIHTFGSVNAMRAALPHMKAAGWGRVINMLSRGAEAVEGQWLSYAAAKAALFAVTRTAAHSCGGTGVLVNGMIPGPTNTAIWGMDMPFMQSPEVTWPPARELMCLPSDGPTGKVFWDGDEFQLFHPDNNGGRSGGARP